MENIFIEQPEFITEDPRTDRPGEVGYSITPEFMLLRHQILLPEELVKDMRVLDLGSCLAASGAWCLSNGAAYYKGVEIHQEFVDKSVECLGKYYKKSRWDVEQCSIEKFLDSNTEKFDVTFASGVLYGLSEPLDTLKLIAETADSIVIESLHTGGPIDIRKLNKFTREALRQDENIVEVIENASYMTVGKSAMVAPGEKSIRFHAFSPSMGALKYIFLSLGFDYHDNINLELKRKIPDVYNPIRRFGMLFTRNPELSRSKWGFASAVEDPTNVIEEIDWNQFT